MNSSLWKVTSIGLASTLLCGVGASCGVWLTAGYYRPLLDAVRDELSQATAARDNLEGLAAEQGAALGKLVQIGQERERQAVLLIRNAQDEAKADYSAANRIQQQRTGGDPAAAAAAIIDQELKL